MVTVGATLNRVVARQNLSVAYQVVSRKTSVIAPHHITSAIYIALAIGCALNRNDGLFAWWKALTGIPSLPLTLAFGAGALFWAWQPRGRWFLPGLLPLIFYGVLWTFYTLDNAIALTTPAFFATFVLLLGVLYRQRWGKLCLRHVISFASLSFAVLIFEAPSLGVPAFIARITAIPGLMDTPFEAAPLFLALLMVVGGILVPNFTDFRRVLICGTPFAVYLFCSLYWTIRTPAAGGLAFINGSALLIMMVYGGIRLTYYLQDRG